MVKDTKQPHYIGHRNRLRQRFMQSGFSGMADHEVIELLLTLSLPRKDVKIPAKELLKRFSNLRGILDAPIEEIMKIKGLGAVTPVALRIIRDLSTLYLQQETEKASILNTPDAIYDFWRFRLGALKDEVFEVAFLDSGYRLLKEGVQRLEEGTKDRATVYPRKVMETALKKGAVALVFAHNHPNGDVRPSEQDKLLTRALVLAATTVQIKIHDHLIFSQDKVFSFSKEGLL
ncbi:MAG TPA: DNA repair protein RadC [Smithellaceae bacterium]|nr:DNA repair protein RadC [Smithellaceae bacterium]